MNRVVWKHVLDDLSGGGQVPMPPDARLLAVGTTDNRHACVWFSLPMSEARSEGPGSRSHWILRTLTPVVTGGPGYVDDVLDYLGTVYLALDGMVLHIYEHHVSGYGKWERES